MSGPHPERVVLAHHAAAVRHLEAVRRRRETQHAAIAARLARKPETPAKPTEGGKQP